VEAAVAAAHEFFARVTTMRSPHALRQAHRFTREATRKGFGDAPLVRAFQEALERHDAIP
ncbi:MAG: hypothetical protein ACRDHP_06250, partial [Ktedonobacterales bacterium]